jgi:hypothetical protein
MLSTSMLAMRRYECLQIRQLARQSDDQLGAISNECQSLSDASIRRQTAGFFRPGRSY